MLSTTYRDAASSAVALASSPPSAPPTPSATIAKTATRWSAKGTCWGSERLVRWTWTRLWMDAIRKWSWFVMRTFPTCVSP